jgi:hypothetical protein
MSVSTSVSALSIVCSVICIIKMRVSLLREKMEEDLLKRKTPPSLQRENNNIILYTLMQKKNKANKISSYKIRAKTRIIILIHHKS